RLVQALGDVSAAPRLRAVERRRRRDPDGRGRASGATRRAAGAHAEGRARTNSVRRGGMRLRRAARRRITCRRLLHRQAAGRPGRRYVPTGLAFLALATLCVAFARPHATSLVPKERATIILVLDVSGSMQASDVRPSRLAAAQQAVRGFLDRVPPNVRIGLVAFSGDAEV